MPRIYLCFLWHMHQPFYKDLLSGEYKLPWTRLHALKDYYGMVKILDEFPQIRQTFNLVPSMMVQIEEYASGKARDPFFDAAIKPAESLTAQEKEFILHHFFHAHPGRMIYRYPRYGELFEAREANKTTPGARGVFGVQEFRDLQVLSQLAWFDEEFQEHDPEVRALVEKGRDYTLGDQALMGRKQREIIGHVIPTYKRLAASGQIEISTTPFYHPILPLLCDSNIAAISHPHVPLPRRFSYPEDAYAQLQMAKEYITRVFGVAPVGLWPSEGSVSDEVFRIASEIGFEWTATDNGVLARTLGRGAGVEETYRPWCWSQRGKKIQVLFRDHLLSDLIGFVYSGMGAHESAGDFLHRIRENCRGILASDRDALVPIILDGENAWEYYDHNARPFFRELYAGITADPQIEAITIRDAFKRLTAEPLDHIFPGSWIGANFDVWIGAQEDNRAWEFLLAAREAFDKAKHGLSEEALKLAWEELLIAEGSDWCWWYGPEHDSANRIEFDELFRSHIANVYRALGMMPAEDLSRPILSVIAVTESKVDPSGAVRPVIDGVVSSYFEWMGAGVYRVDQRSGSMHGKRFLVRELYFGTDAENLYLRIDFREDASDLMESLDCRFVFRPNGVGEETVVLHIEHGHITVREAAFPVKCAYRTILEIALPLAKIQKAPERPLRFNASFWHGGLPVDALPQQGWLEVRTDEWDVR
ncbi:MAG: glycoside hydrolase, family 57 [Bryobacterales bacterium]|nr:glycoside hydrolase, family 57 [Bryobacterales bacterium]